VNRAGAGVEYDIVPVQFVLMYQIPVLLDIRLKKRLSHSAQTKCDSLFPENLSVFLVGCDFLVLAGLVGNTAAGLAGGLTGSLALAATAVLGALAKVSGVQGLNSFHGNISVLSVADKSLQYIIT